MKKDKFFLNPYLQVPKGTVLVECGKMLAKNGYVIKSLNTINFKKSMHYNPFAYIRSEKDILKLVNTIIVNTKGDGDKSGEDFWVKAEKLLYTAYIGYIWYEAPKHEQNFATLLEMINASEAREDDESFKNPVDLMFEELEQKDPEHFAVKQYKKYKLAAGKTAKSILISCGARLAPFDIAELRELMSYDENASWFCCCSTALGGNDCLGCLADKTRVHRSLTPSARERRHCSSSSAIQTTLSTLSWQSCTRSYSISYATKQTTNTAAGCLSTSDAF